MIIFCRHFFQLADCILSDLFLQFKKNKTTIIKILSYNGSPFFSDCIANQKFVRGTHTLNLQGMLDIRITVSSGTYYKFVEKNYSFSTMTSIELVYFNQQSYLIPVKA